MVKIEKGNVLKAKETIIAHQVNCFGVAGGLAYAVFTQYPNALKEYLKICDRPGKELLLGHCQCIKQNDGHIIANLFGQYRPGADTKMEAVKKSSVELKNFAQKNNARIALPWKIGCGIGGGNWEEMQELIAEILGDCDVTIYKLDN